MLKLSSKRDQERIREAVDNASAAAGAPDPLRRLTASINLLVAGEDYSREIKGVSWGQAEIPITMEALLAQRLPERLNGETVTLSAQFGDIHVPQVPGEKTLHYPSESPYETDLLAASPGSLLHGDDAVSLNEYTEYYGQRPENVVWDIVRRLPYDHTLMDIAPVPGVSLDFNGTGSTPGFLAEELTGDVLSRLADAEIVGYDFRDTAQKGFVAELPAALGRSKEPVRTYSAERMPDWLKQRPTPPDAQWHSVRVYKHDDAGKVLFEWIEPIPYVGLQRKPHAGRVLHIPFDDSSPDAFENARRHCVYKALELARRPTSGETLLPCFDPLIERADRFRVTEAYRDDDGLWDILWVLRTENYKHVYGSGSAAGVADAGILGTQIKYSAATLEKDRVAVPTIILGIPSLGNVRQPRDSSQDIREYWGVLATDLYFDSPLTWVKAEPNPSGDAGAEPTDLVFYDDAPIAIQGDELVVYK